LKALEHITNTSYASGTTATIDGLIQRDVMEPNPIQLKFIEKLEQITGETLSTEQRGGVSDANHTAGAGVVTTDGWGPFGDGDHTIHERASKSSFKQRIQMMTKILNFHQTNGCKFN
jgi:glutamate carboxypeptidase